MHFGFSPQSCAQPEDDSANRCRLCEKSSEVSRPPLASCRSLCSTAIALLLVILVRSLRHQGWRDLRRLDRGALLHGGGTFPFERQWGRSYFHAISQEPLLQKAPAGAPPYLRMTRIGLLVSDSVGSFLCSFGCIRPNLSNFCRSCCNHERPTQPIRYAATAVFSTITIRRKPFFIQITYGSQISYRTLRGAENCIRTKLST